MLVTPHSFDLAIQLTTDTPENGGLSGATLSEAVSWGKISENAKFVTVYGDATITLPMMVTATMERLELPEK
jgi:deoxyhypusine synthase